MRIFRRTISMLLILLLVISCMPLGAFAEGNEDQEIVIEETVPETTVETEITEPPEEETLPDEREDLPEEVVPNENTVINPVDDAPEETEPGNEDTVTETQEENPVDSVVR